MKLRLAATLVYLAILMAAPAAAPGWNRLANGSYVWVPIGSMVHLELILALPIAVFLGFLTPKLAEALHR